MAPETPATCNQTVPVLSHEQSPTVEAQFAHLSNGVTENGSLTCGCQVSTGFRSQVPTAVPFEWLVSANTCFSFLLYCFCSWGPALPPSSSQRAAIHFSKVCSVPICHSIVTGYPEHSFISQVCSLQFGPSVIATVLSLLFCHVLVLCF